jgi:hypothetical protein
MELNGGTLQQMRHPDIGYERVALVQEARLDPGLLQ